VTDSVSDIGVVHYGLGPIGRSIAAVVARRAGLSHRAAIDVDPTLHGRTLADVLSTSTRPSPPIVGRLADADLQGAHVAVHSTGSSLKAVLPQLLELIDRGLHVVSTCEELSWMERGTEAARELDAHANDRGVAILGTGVNPGFVMDYLPLVVSAAMSSVNRVAVVRVQDAGTRRLPLQRKVGAGLDVAEFDRLVAAGRLGHVGLRQSASAIASAFGWVPRRYEEQIEPVIAQEVTRSESGDIGREKVLGIHQTARLEANHDHVVTLDLTMAIGAKPSHDRVLLSGDQDLELHVPGGLHGDAATAAIVVNTIPRLLQVRPGLRTMADMPPPHPWSD